MAMANNSIPRAGGFGVGGRRISFIIVVALACCGLAASAGNENMHGHRHRANGGGGGGGEARKRSKLVVAATGRSGIFDDVGGIVGEGSSRRLRGETITSTAATPIATTAATAPASKALTSGGQSTPSASTPIVEGPTPKDVIPTYYPTYSPSDTADSPLSASSAGSLPTPSPSADSKLATSPTKAPSRIQTTTKPIKLPTQSPSSGGPSSKPSARPTPKPTALPTTKMPTESPTIKPVTPTQTKLPTRSPTSSRPSNAPTNEPSLMPTYSPTSESPTLKPVSKSPTKFPTRSPTSSRPSNAPTDEPSLMPTYSPTSESPTLKPVTKSPTKLPTRSPTSSRPSNAPTDEPSLMPTYSPTSESPTLKPVTKSPTKLPTRSPTSSRPSNAPTNEPSLMPVTKSPTETPSSFPSSFILLKIPTKVPTDIPSELPSTSIPSHAPSSNSSIIINSAIELEQREEISTQSLAIYTVTGAVVLLAVLVVVIFVRKRSHEGSCDDDDLENNIARINVTDKFGVAGSSENLSRDNKRSIINARDRDGTLPIVKDARMTSLLDNMDSCESEQHQREISALDLAPEQLKDAIKQKESNIFVFLDERRGIKSGLHQNMFESMFDMKHSVSSLSNPSQFDDPFTPTPRGGLGGRFNYKNVEKMIGDQYDTRAIMTPFTPKGNGNATPSRTNYSFSSPVSIAQKRSYHKEKLFDVYAPPGPLGIIIDTTPEGPMIHSLKPSSQLLGLVNPGDLIVGLDGVDTRNMTAATFTRLMAKRSQGERKITLLKGFEPLTPTK